MKKTKLVIFRPQKLKIDHSFKFKLDGKRLVPTHSVKYLGVLIDEFLPWNKQVAQIKMRLNCANRHAKQAPKKCKLLYTENCIPFTV